MRAEDDVLSWIRWREVKVEIHPAIGNRLRGVELGIGPAAATENRRPGFKLSKRRATTVLLTVPQSGGDGEWRVGRVDLIRHRPR